MEVDEVMPVISARDGPTCKRAKTHTLQRVQKLSADSGHQIAHQMRGRGVPPQVVVPVEGIAHPSIRMHDGTDRDPPLDNVLELFGRCGFDHGVPKKPRQ